MPSNRIAIDREPIPIRPAGEGLSQPSEFFRVPMLLSCATGFARAPKEQCVRNRVFQMHPELGGYLPK
jgi:hypothetical protein